MNIGAMFSRTYVSLIALFALLLPLLLVKQRIGDMATPFDKHRVELLRSLTEADLLTEKVIPDDFWPRAMVDVEYGDRAVAFGNRFRVSEVKNVPAIAITSEVQPEEDSASYTLMLIDPDAPTPDDPRFAYWRHWVVSGLRTGKTNDSQTLTDYLAPGPKDESEPHRYLFLLFREPNSFGLTKEDVGGEEFVQRRSFRAAELAHRHGLQLVAINWMRGVGDGWEENNNSSRRALGDHAQLG